MRREMLARTKRTETDIRSAQAAPTITSSMQSLMSNNNNNNNHDDEHPQRQFPMEIRHSQSEVIIFRALACFFVLLFSMALIFDGNNPKTSVLQKIVLGVACLVAFPGMAIMTSRFFIRVDEYGITKREFLTRFIPWEDIQLISVRPGKPNPLTERWRIMVMMTNLQQHPMTIEHRSDMLKPFLQVLQTHKPELLDVNLTTY